MLPRRHLIAHSLHSCAREVSDAQSSQSAAQLTQCRIGVGDWRIGSNSLVLTVDEDPQTNVLGSVVVLTSDLSAKVDESLGLEDAVRRNLGGRDGAVVEGGEVEALVTREGLVGDDLCVDRSAAHYTI